MGAGLWRRPERSRLSGGAKDLAGNTLAREHNLILESPQ
jgi:hypothetical protein